MSVSLETRLLDVLILFTSVTTYRFNHTGVFERTQAPLAFEFQSERLNGNSATKQSLNYHLSDMDKVGQMAERQFGDKTVAELIFGHLTDF